MTQARTKRRAPQAAALAVLTASVAVVAIAASSSLSNSTPIGATSARAPVTALFLALVGAGALLLSALAALMWQGRRRRGDDELESTFEPRPVHWIWKVLAVLVLFAIGGVIVAAAALGTKPLQPAPRIASGRGLAGPLSRPAPNASGGSGFALPGWLPWTILAIVLAAATIGVLLSIWRRAVVTDEPLERTQARDAVDAALGALDARADPRSAVIAAYVAMTSAFAANNVVRAPSEAPREYLGRVLRSASAPAREATTLTSLFEEARFSKHPITESVRELALSTLRALRASLSIGKQT